DQLKEEAVFGGRQFDALSEEEQLSILAEVMPVIRGAVSDEKKMLLTYDNAADILEFVNSRDAAELSQVGAACPDHLVHTKMKPLYIDWDPSSKDIEQLIEAVKAGITKFKEEYKAYFERNKNE